LLVHHLQWLIAYGISHGDTLPQAPLRNRNNLRNSELTAANHSSRKCIRKHTETKGGESRCIPPSRLLSNCKKGKGKTEELASATTKSLPQGRHNNESLLQTQKEQTKQESQQQKPNKYRRLGLGLG